MEPCASFTVVRSRSLVAVAAAAVSLLAPAVADAAARGGALSQLGGRSGCVYDPHGGTAQGIHVDLPRRCGTAAALDGAYDVATSPDGRHLYVASFNGDSISIFARDKRTGALRQLAGSNGCVIEDPYDSPCAAATALDNPSAIAVSPDGKNVYATGFYGHSIVAFARDPATGALRQLPGTAGCTSASEADYECSYAEGLGGPTALVVSPDGRNVYVAAAFSSTVVAFSRSASSGALRQLAGADGCVRDTSEGPNEGDVCAGGNGLDSAGSIAITRDGKSLYVASFGTASVAIFARDAASGRLTQDPGLAGCLSEERLAGVCASARSLEGAFAVAVTRDGKNVYVATGFDRRVDERTGAFAGSGVSVFARNTRTGGLRQLAGRAGCITHDPTPSRCADGRALEGAQAVTVSPDGRNVYLAAAASNAVSIFSRNLKTGALAQLRGKAGCVSESGTRGACVDGAGLWGVSALAISPDGRHAYAPGFFSSAVAVFARTAPARRSGR